MFLSAADLEELTGKKQHAAQVRVLRFMGIEHKQRPDGTVAVLKQHIEKELDGNCGIANVKRSQQPTWGDIK